MNIKETKNYEINNGHGKITFSKDLFKSIINNILEQYPNYKYRDHHIKPLVGGYLEVSIFLSSPAKFEVKVTERIQKDLLNAIKNSLSLNCILALNFGYGK